MGAQPEDAEERLARDAQDLQAEAPPVITEPKEGVWYELCPDCEGECDGCMTCWDQLTPHVCEEV